MKELCQMLTDKIKVTHRGFPVTLSSNLFDSDEVVPIRWEGSAGFHVKPSHLAELQVSPFKIK